MSDRLSERLYLSPPDVGEAEVEAVTRALRSGWVAPLGPEVDAFEADIAAYTGAKYAVALSSGTAALHLGLLGLDVQSGDDVLLPTLTFGATAFAVTYVGANPVFLDVEEESWNLDPELLEGELERRAAVGRLPAAVISVDLFGTPCNYERIVDITDRYGTPLLCDAAESLGASAAGKSVGQFGKATVFSFNGNKIITTSGGGMLVTDDQEFAYKVRYRATQAREPLAWYEHNEVGYNYRMSNLLASVGRAQLNRLPEIVETRRFVRHRYMHHLQDTSGVHVMDDAAWCISNAWLTCIRIDSEMFPGAPEQVRLALELLNIESRPVWKPMHQQPVFVNSSRKLTGVADSIFAEGLCLPSGNSITEHEIQEVCAVIKSVVSVD